MDQQNGQDSDLDIGMRVRVAGKYSGTIRFMGFTHFAENHWVGVELDQCKGKNDGIVQGRRYFQCRDNHGIFVRPSLVQIPDALGARDPPPIKAKPHPAAAVAQNMKAITSAPPPLRKSKAPPQASPPQRNADAGAGAGGQGVVSCDSPGSGGGPAASPRPRTAPRSKSMVGGTTFEQRKEESAKARQEQRNAAATAEEFRASVEKLAERASALEARVAVVGDALDAATKATTAITALEVTFQSIGEQLHAQVLEGLKNYADTTVKHSMCQAQLMA